MRRLILAFMLSLLAGPAHSATTATGCLQSVKANVALLAWIQSSIVSNRAVNQGNAKGFDLANTGAVRAPEAASVRYAERFSGADAGAKIAAAIAVLPSTGGMVDARGLDGLQTWSSDPFLSVAKPGTLLIGAATHTLLNDVSVPSNWTIEIQSGGSFSVVKGKTLTIGGDVFAPLSQIFTGAIK